MICYIYLHFTHSLSCLQNTVRLLVVCTTELRLHMPFVTDNQAQTDTSTWYCADIGDIGPSSVGIVDTAASTRPIPVGCQRFVTKANAVC